MNNCLYLVINNRDFDISITGNYILISSDVCNIDVEKIWFFNTDNFFQAVIPNLI